MFANCVKQILVASEFLQELTAVGIPFHGDDVEATVFIRTPPKESTTPNAIVTDTIAQIEKMESEGIYDELKIFRGSGEKERKGWEKAAFTAKVDGALIVSVVYATLKNKHTIKIRITTKNPRSESFRKFVTEIQEAIDVKATKP